MRKKTAITLVDENTDKRKGRNTRVAVIPGGFKPSLHRTRKVGLMLFGGTGVNVGEEFLEALKFDTYRNFRIFVADTDAQFLAGKFEKPSDGQKEWSKAGALFFHQLGGEEVSGGSGAGADPEVGKKAASTDSSMKAMKAFMESVDELVLVGSAGGGTGAGALPVAAELANTYTDKSALAVVIMPSIKEGRTAIAQAMLSKTEKLVTTHVIENEELLAWLKETLPPAEAKKISRKTAWRRVTKLQLVPVLTMILEVIARTGDTQNVDLADWRSSLKKANGGEETRNAYFGQAVMEKTDNIEEVTASGVVDKLLDGKLQKAGIITQGHAALVLFYGEWPIFLADAVMEMLRERILGGDKTRNLVLYPGTREGTDNGDMWVAIMIIARNVSPSKLKIGAQSRQVFSAPTPSAMLPKAREVLALPAAVEAPEELHAQVVSGVMRVAEEKKSDAVIRFYCGNNVRNFNVAVELAERFDRIYNNSASSKDEVTQLCDEVEKTVRCRPNMPPRFTSFGNWVSRFKAHIGQMKLST